MNLPVARYGVESDAMIRLTVKQGSIVQTLTVDAEKAFVGRLDTNSVRLDDPSVSRKHCMIRRNSKGGLEVLDLNSRHGTRMNGRSVDRAPVNAGDEIGVGSFRIYVENPEELLPTTRAASAGSGAPPGRPAREAKDLLSSAHRETFSEQLYHQLRRVPWWAASVFLHTVLVYLLFLVSFQPGVRATPFGSIHGTLDGDHGSPEDTPVSASDALADLEPEPEEAPFPALDELEPSPATDATLPQLAEPELREIGPSLDDISAPMFRRGSVSMELPAIPEADFGQDGARTANEEATELVRRSLEAGGGSSLGLLKKLSSREVLVVTGHYDKVETVLDLLNLDFEIVDVRRFERLSLSGRKVLFVNCSNEAPSRGAVEKIRKFVKGGGYLIGSDWAVENVHKYAFEGYIEPLTRRGRNVITPNEVIRIRAAPGQERHFLLTGTEIMKGTAKWWLEESSYPFRVLKPGVVQTLIESEDLQREYGARAVAVTFRYGQGRVLHMLGHFFQKEGNLRGAFSAQRLVANFLIAAVRGK
jgi:hypothetical protein